MPTVCKKNIPDQLAVSASGVHRDASSVTTSKALFINKSRTMLQLSGCI